MEIIKEAEENQIYDPIRKRFKYSKRRATDILEHNKVKLPEEVNIKHEKELGMLRDIVMLEFEKFKREIEKKEDKEGVKEEKRKNQERENLTSQEKRGLKKLLKRIKEKGILVFKTDKGGNLMLI